jgi:Na+-driven multidrug efflux pump
MQITNSVAQIMGNVMLQIWGGDLYVGIMTVINSVREVMTMPLMGLANGAKPVMSFNYGAKQFDRVKNAIRFITVVCILLSVGVWALLFFCPRFFMELFNDDPALIEMGIPAMRLYFSGIFMMSLQFAGQATFTALGCARHAVFFSTFRKVAIVAPLSVLLPSLWGLGTDGVFLAEPVSNYVGGIACYLTMMIVVRKKLQQEKTT